MWENEKIIIGRLIEEYKEASDESMDDMANTHCINERMGVWKEVLKLINNTEELDQKLESKIKSMRSCFAWKPGQEKQKKQQNSISSPTQSALTRIQA